VSFYVKTDKPEAFFLVFYKFVEKRRGVKWHTKKLRLESG
jgi:hypothetical protein